MPLELSYARFDGTGDGPQLVVLPEDAPDRKAVSNTGSQDAWRDVPLLTIKGGGSEYMPAEHFEALARWFRMHDTRIIENAGHWLYVERKAEFVEVVAKILDI